MIQVKKQALFNKEALTRGVTGFFIIGLTAATAAYGG
jgi:hypothetical protein